MNNITVLVTACCAQHIPGLIDCIKNNGEREIKIIGTDVKYDKTIFKLVDAFYQVPIATDENYGNIILDICKKEKVDIVLPLISAELIPLLKLQEKFEQENIKLSISNIKSIETTINKLNFYNFMKENNLPTVNFYEAKNITQVIAAINKLGYPKQAVCIKPTESCGSRGVRIIDPNKSKYDIMFNEKPNSMYISYEELLDTLAEKENISQLVIMDAIDGDEFSVDVLAENGIIKYIGCRKSDVILASIPQEATIMVDYKAEEICNKIVKLLNFDGNIDFDFRYDSAGNPILLEVNPRLAATISIFKAGGINFPYLRIKQLLGEELPQVLLHLGTKMVRRYVDMFEI